MDLLTDILGSGPSARIYRKLVYEQQIASEASCYVDGREMPGLCHFYALANEPEQDIDGLERAIEAVIADVMDNGVLESELEKAKNKTQARHVASRVTVQGKADQLAHAAIFYKNTERANTLIDSYLEVTVQDIRRVAAEYLTPKNRSTVIYKPSEEVSELAELEEQA
jgi:zinc protease